MDAHAPNSHDGIVGGVRHMVERITARNSDPLRWIIRLVGGAAIILIARKAGFQLDGANAIIIMALGLAALLGEFYFSGEAVRNWFERSAVGLVAFALLWTCAFGYSVNQWLGAASDGQFEKAGAQKAAYTRTVDAAATEKELAADVARIQQKLKLSPTRTPEAAQAAIDNAKAHRWFERTEQCTKTLGPQTRQFCDDYASAVADKSLATEALTLKEDLKVKQRELAAIRLERKDAPQTVTDERTDLRIYTKYAGLSQETAMDVQAAGTIIFISIVMSGLGMLTEARRHRGQPTKPWGIWRALRQVSYRIRRAIWGGAATAPEVHNHSTTIHGIQYHQMLAGGKAA